MARRYTWVKLDPAKWMSDEVLLRCRAEGIALWIQACCYMYRIESARLSGSVEDIQMLVGLPMSQVEEGLRQLETHSEGQYVIREGGTVTLYSKKVDEVLTERADARERKRLSRENQSSDDVTEDVTEQVTDDVTHSLSRDNARSSNSLVSSSNSSGKEKGGVGEKGKPKYVSRAPPDLNEVSEYFVEQGSSRREAEKFRDHFQSQGWKLGNGNPMKDWKAAARNWMRRSDEFGRKRKHNTFTEKHGNLIE